MIDFLDNASKLMCKTELLPLTHSFPVAVSNLKYNLLPEPSGCECVKLYRRHQRYLFVCQVILQIMKICVHV